MKRKFIAAGAASALVVGGGAWMGLGSATATTAKPSIHGWPGAAGASAAKTIAIVRADAATAGSQVLLLHEHGVRNAFIDVSGDGQSVGDYFMGEGQLMYQGHSQVIGLDSGRCTFGPRTVMCDATFQLRGKGKIMVYGAVYSRRDNVYAVTGGTGLYKGVGGQVKAAALPHGDTLFAFELAR